MDPELDKVEAALRKDFDVETLQYKRYENAIFLLNKKMILKVGDANISKEYIIHHDIYNSLSFSNKKHVVEPIDLGGTSSEKFRDTYFYPMEYVNGISFKKFLEQKKINQKKLKKIKNQLLKLFTEIWKLGYIHGDLHLDNILILPNGNIKVIDFGFALKTTPLKNNKHIKEWFIPTWEKFLVKQHLLKGNPNGWVAGISPNMFAKHHKNLLKSKFF